MGWLVLFALYVYTGLGFVDSMLEGSRRGLILTLFCLVGAAFTFIMFYNEMKSILNTQD